MAWSPDGKRLVYHHGTAGDPIFVADLVAGRPSDDRQIFAGSGPDVHCHYPIWSPDGQWIYFVSGYASTSQMDVYRISPNGGQPERLTQHNAYVADPVPIGLGTVLYLARAEDGTGPWLHALDVEKKITHRVGRWTNTIHFAQRKLGRTARSRLRGQPERQPMERSDPR